MPVAAFRRARPLLHGYHPGLRIAVASVLIFVGLVGFILPIIPGIPFFVLGLLVLAGVWPAFGRFVRSRLRRYPKLLAVAKALRRKRTT